VFIKPEDEVYDFVQRPHLPNITVKKGLSVTDDIVVHCFDIDYFMDMCQKLKHDMKSVTAQYREAYKDVEKSA
jgi:hypothetical protein